MNIRRQTLANGTDIKDIQEKLKEEASKLNFGETRDQNEHGPVYINAKYDLRIERDPGNWGAYRIMLLHKEQPETSFFSRFRKNK